MKHLLVFLVFVAGFLAHLLAVAALLGVVALSAWGGSVLAVRLHGPDAFVGGVVLGILAALAIIGGGLAILERVLNR